MVKLKALVTKKTLFASNKTKSVNTAIESGAFWAAKATLLFRTSF